VIRGAPASPPQMRELSTAAIAQVSSGKLKPLIGQTFPLERAADAHAAIEARATVGKTLLLARGTAARGISGRADPRSAYQRTARPDGRHGQLRARL